jgi:hypothetical protein
VAKPRGSRRETLWQRAMSAPRGRDARSVKRTSVNATTHGGPPRRTPTLGWSAGGARPDDKQARGHPNRTGSAKAPREAGADPPAARERRADNQADDPGRAGEAPASPAPAEAPALVVGVGERPHVDRARTVAIAFESGTPFRSSPRRPRARASRESGNGSPTLKRSRGSALEAANRSKAQQPGAARGSPEPSERQAVADRSSCSRLTSRRSPVRAGHRPSSRVGCPLGRSGSEVSVSQPLRSVGPSVWISSVAAAASPPVSLRQATGSSRSCAAVRLTPVALGRL